MAVLAYVIVPLACLLITARALLGQAEKRAVRRHDRLVAEAADAVRAARREACELTREQEAEWAHIAASLSGEVPK